MLNLTLDLMTYKMRKLDSVTSERDF